MPDYCLNLICPPAVEEKLLDVLLAHHTNEILTSVGIHSHGTAHARLSTEEEVMGRSRSMHIHVLLDEEALLRLVQRIRGEFSGTGIRYWATPVAFQGEVE